MNWFVALNGKVQAVTPGSMVPMNTAGALQAFRAGVADGALVWCASCASVVGIAGFGLSPEAAIRAFEERMKLDG